MTYASADDVSVRWGRPITDEQKALIEARLADVERMIKRRIKDLDAKITAGTVDIEDVKQVEADAVLRIVKNPDGFLQETDGDYSYMLSADTASGRLEILPEEWERLGYIKSRMFQLVPDWEAPT